MKCAICGIGMVEGVNLFRVNDIDKGEPTDWRCEVHIGDKKIDPAVMQIVSEIEAETEVKH